MLLNGMTYKPGTAVKNNEAQFLETFAAIDAEIFGLWSFPPHRAARLDRATNNNIAHQSLEFVIYCLAPFIDALQQSASQHLLVGDDAETHFCEFNLSGLLRGDPAARAAFYAAGRQWGWLSINDVRRLENQRGIGPAGDGYLEPINMKRAGDPDPAASERQP